MHVQSHQGLSPQNRLGLHSGSRKIRKVPLKGNLAEEKLKALPGIQYFNGVLRTDGNAASTSVVLGPTLPNCRAVRCQV